MPRAFSDNEKEYIKKKLLEYGKELFGRLGLRKTTVQELAEGAGIAKGSFYLFYSTKEELFVDILDEVEKDIQSEIIREFQASRQTPKEALKTILLKQFRFFVKSPFLKSIMDPREFEYLQRKAPPGWKERSLTIDENFTGKLFKLWPDQTPDINPATLASVFRGIVIMVLHKEEVGNFDEALFFLVDSVVDKIFGKGGRE